MTFLEFLSSRREDMLTLGLEHVALVGVALRAASPTEEPATGAIAAIGAMRGFLAEIGLRPSLRSLGFDDEMLDVVAQDAIDDAAIDNSPRLPMFDQARAILGSVLG